MSPSATPLNPSGASFLDHVLPVKREEWPRAILMFLYFFLIMTSYYILKPVRNALFLEGYGAENLPYIWLITIAVLWAVATVYVRFSALLKNHVLVSWTVASFASHIFIFWWLAAYPVRWLSVVFYVWVSIFSSFTVTQFWLFANDLFDPREAKRLFGFVGSGGILGGMCGGSLTSWLVHSIGARNLLIVAAFVLLASILTINLIWRFEKARVAPPRPPRAGKPAMGSLALLGTLGRTRYLLLLVGIVMFAKAVSTLVEFQFNALVEVHVVGLNERAGFFGAFYRWLNIVALLVQFFLTSRILRSFGVGSALALLPASLCTGSLAILLAPSLAAGAFTMMCDGSLNYSLNQSTREVLYLPIAREVRHRAKPFIDMVFYRLAKAVGSVLILAGTRLLDLTASGMSAIVLALSALWMTCIAAMRKEYPRELRRNLAREVEHRKPGGVERSEVMLAHLVLEDLLKDEAERAKAIAIFHLSGEEEFCLFLRGLVGARAARLASRLKDVVADSSAAAEWSGLERLLDEASEQDIAAFATVLGRAGAGSPEEALACAASASARVKIFSVVFLCTRGFWAPESARLLAEALGASEDAKLQDRFDLYLKEARARGPDSARLFDWVIRSLEEDVAEGELGAAGNSPEASEAIHLLEEVARLEGVARSQRRRLPALLAQFASQEAIDALTGQLVKAGDPDFRYHAIKALKGTPLEEHGIVIKQEDLEGALAAELKQCDLEISLRSRARELLAGADAQDGFREVIKERIRETQERVFQLIGLLGNAEEADLVYRAFQSRSLHLKANALELLDTVVSSHLRKQVIAVFERDVETQGPEPSGAPQHEGLGGTQEESTSLEALAQEADGWLALASLYLARRFQVTALRAAAHALHARASGLARAYAGFVATTFDATA